MELRFLIYPFGLKINSLVCERVFKILIEIFEFEIFLYKPFLFVKTRKFFSLALYSTVY